jgi:anti-anti-sigma factor
MMEITVTELGEIELFEISGRVDSVEAPRFDTALQDANHRGRFNLVIDMRQLEYMSSAGFRALAASQRNSRRHNRGDVVLVNVPAMVHEALDLVGFAEHFSLFDDLESAQEYLMGDESSTGDSQTLTSET